MPNLLHSRFAGSCRRRHRAFRELPPHSALAQRGRFLCSDPARSGGPLDVVRKGKGQSADSTQTGGFLGKQIVCFEHTSDVT